MSILTDLQQQYNKNLTRLKKGEVYLDGPASDTEKEKWLPKFLELIKEGNELILQIEQTGHEMTDYEIINGFEIKA